MTVSNRCKPEFDAINSGKGNWQCIVSIKYSQPNFNQVYSGKRNWQCLINWSSKPEFNQLYSGKKILTNINKAQNDTVSLPYRFDSVFIGKLLESFYE